MSKLPNYMRRDLTQEETQFCEAVDAIDWRIAQAVREDLQSGATLTNVKARFRALMAMVER